MIGMCFLISQYPIPLAPTFEGHIELSDLTAHEHIT